MRSLQAGRIRHWTMRDITGSEMVAEQLESVVVNDLSAIREAALLGLGITLVAVPDVRPDLNRGDLVRPLPHWYADAGAISIYFASRAHLPAKTRAFVDSVGEAIKGGRLAVRFAGSLE